MKQPRIEAFTPKAPATLKSGFEQMPTIQKPPTREETSRAEEMPMSAPTAVLDRSERAYDRTGVRVIKRHAFEFYQDQLDILKRISLEDQMHGGKGSQSEMVREAIDEYLAKRRGGK